MQLSTRFFPPLSWLLAYALIGLALLVLTGCGATLRHSTIAPISPHRTTSAIFERLGELARSEHMLVPLSDTARGVFTAYRADTNVSIGRVYARTWSVEVRAGMLTAHASEVRSPLVALTDHLANSSRIRVEDLDDTTPDFQTWYWTIRNALPDVCSTGVRPISEERATR